MGGVRKEERERERTVGLGVKGQYCPWTHVSRALKTDRFDSNHSNQNCNYNFLITKVKNERGKTHTHGYYRDLNS